MVETFVCSCRLYFTYISTTHVKKQKTNHKDLLNCELKLLLHKSNPAVVPESETHRKPPFLFFLQHILSSAVLPEGLHSQMFPQEIGKRCKTERSFCAGGSGATFTQHPNLADNIEGHPATSPMSLPLPYGSNIAYVWIK